MADFPRGGVAGGTSAQDVKRGAAAPSSSSDAIFGASARTKRIEVVADKSKSSAKNKKPKTKGDANGSSSGGSTASNSFSGFGGLLGGPGGATMDGKVGLGATKLSANGKTLKIEAINFGKYTPGTLALGYVLQVNESRAIVSLPGGVVGTVEVGEVSDSAFRQIEMQRGEKKRKLSGNQAGGLDIRTLLKPLQPVRCFVIGVQDRPNGGGSGKKNLALSMRSSYINKHLQFKHLMPEFPVSACIVSKEDHGYVVSAGMSGVNFFLPSKAVPEALGEIAIGQPIETVVESTNEGSRIVTLRAQRKVVGEALTRGSQLTFLACTPGMLVNAVVDAVLANGLICNFLGIFNGTIDEASLGRLAPHAEWSKRYTAGDVLLARIVFVDHAMKCVRLSLRPHVVELTGPTNLPSLGSLLQNCTVAVINKKQGVLCSLAPEVGEDDEDEDAPAEKLKGKKAALEEARRARKKDAAILSISLHKHSLAAQLEPDAKTVAIEGDKIDKIYKVGKVVPNVRVMGYHLVEGVVSGSTLPAHTRDTVLHSSEIEPGQLVKCVVQSVKDFGLVVKIDNRVQAVLPSLHLTNTATSQTKVPSSYKPNQTLNVRVWEVDGSAIIVTMKKVLIDETAPLLSLANATRGTVCAGVVGKLTAEGLTVHFYNKLRGSLDAQVLQKQGVLDLQDAFTAGHVIKCIVLGFEAKSGGGKGKKQKKSNRLSLALLVGKVATVLEMFPVGSKGGGVEEMSGDMDVDEDVDDDSVKKNKQTSEAQQSEPSYTAGQVIKIDATKRILQLRLDDGRLAEMPMTQCFDSAAAAEKFFSYAANKNASTAPSSSLATFQVGSRLERCLILSGGKKFVTISAKPLLLSEEHPCPAAVSEFQPGKVVSGFVHKIESFGLLIKFRNNVTAIVPKSAIADGFLETHEGRFTLGDSVRAVVQKVDPVTEKVVLSVKPSVVPPSTLGANYLTSHVVENLQVALANQREGKQTLPKAPALWQTRRVGSVVKAIVTTVEDYGIVLTDADNTTMYLVKEKLSSVKIGASMAICVLDVDYDGGVFIASFDKGLTSSKAKKEGKGKAAGDAPSSGDKIKARVEFLRDSYLIVSLPTKGSERRIVAFLMLADYHYPSLTSTGYSRGDEVDVTVLPTTAPTDLSFPHANAIVCAPSSAAEIKESDKKKVVGDADTLRTKFQAALRVGSVMRFKVKEIKSTELKLSPEHNDIMGIDIECTVHVTGAIDKTLFNDNLAATLAASKKGDYRAASKRNFKDDDKSVVTFCAGHPFSAYSVGDSVLCRVVQIRKAKTSVGEEGEESNKASKQPKQLIYLEVLTAEEKERRVKSKEVSTSMLQWSGRESIRAKTAYACVITHVAPLHCTVALSPYITAQLSYLNVTKDAALLENFVSNVFVGQRLIVCVSERGEKDVSLSRRAVESEIGHDSSVLGRVLTIEEEVQEVVAGKLTLGLLDLLAVRGTIKAPPALCVRLPGGLIGRVCVTELVDKESWSDLSAASGAGGKVLGMSSTITNTTASLPIGMKHGQVVRCRVLFVSPIELSLRPSRVGGKGKAALAVDTPPAEGDIVQAFVANASTKGVFLRISSALTGQVMMKNLSDDFIEKPSEAFPVGKLVQARVLSVSHTDATAQLSLKASAIVSDTSIAREFQRLAKKVGKIVPGIISRIDNNHGVFIQIEGTSIVAISRKINAADLPSKGSENKAVDLNEHYKVGDTVRCRVLEVSAGSRKASVGLKSSFFRKGLEEEDAEDESDDDEDDEDEGEADAMAVDEDEEESDDDNDDDEDGEDDSSNDEDTVKMVDDADEDEDSDEDDEEEDDDDDEEEDLLELDAMSDDGSDDEMEALIRQSMLPVADDDDDEEDEEAAAPPPQKKAKSSKPAVVVQEADNDDDDDEDSDSDSDDEKKPVGKQQSSMPVWDDFQPSQAAGAAPMDQDEDSDDDEDDQDADSDEEQGHGRKRGRDKVAKSRLTEATTREKEKRAASSAAPETALDYEKLLLAEPGNSFLWVQFMAFKLEQADIDGARGVAARALQKIGFREEEEKYNVWLAWLKLEHDYGDKKTLGDAFARGVAESKGKLLHLHMAEVCEQAGSLDNATEYLKKALKKYKYSKKVWMALQHFHLRQGKPEVAKQFLQRALQSLSKHKHVEVITKFASAEFEMGSVDRGRVLFEELVSNYPKRTDLWHVYIDKEAKGGHSSQARQLFERMLSMRLNVKNTKAVFKKYLDFEKRLGTPATVDGVMNKARAYAETLH